MLDDPENDPLNAREREGYESCQAKYNALAPRFLEELTELARNYGLVLEVRGGGIVLSLDEHAEDVGEYREISGHVGWA